MMQQYTQAIGYVPVRYQQPGIPQFSTTRFADPAGYAPWLRRGHIDRSIRAGQLDRTFRASRIDRAGRAIMPGVYRGSTIHSTHGALGNPELGAWTTFWMLAGVVSGGLCAYHGYKRNDSVGWAIVWGLLGGAFPVITPAIALAQGFGKPKQSP
jgi:hypothetical protein